MSELVATNLLVPGRGHELGPDGSLELSESAVQRVGAAVLYHEQNRGEFERAYADGSGGVVAMSGGYAALATANRMAPPPYEEREGTKMAALGETMGIPARYLRIDPSSTSTMENLLRAQEAGFFRELSPENPLGIVTQESQLGRLAWFAQKIFKITPDAIVHVDAPGEEDEQILRDEHKLLRITELAYGIARTPNGLRSVERALGVAAAITTRLGLQHSPADSYLANES
jgi:hypothetical protein